MVGMSDEEAKAAQEIAKATGKGIVAAEKAGGFFARIFGQSIEDTVGAFWGDPIRARRIERGIELSLRVQKKLEDAGITDIRPLSDKIGIALIENATLEDDPTLKEMWENLMAAALDPSDSLVEKDYIQALSNLTTKDAVLLKVLFERRYVGAHYVSDTYDEAERRSKEQLSVFYPRFVSTKLGHNIHNLRNLFRHDILQSTIEEIHTVQPFTSVEDGHDIETQSVEVSNGFNELEFSLFGLDLTKKILGEK